MTSFNKKARIYHTLLNKTKVSSIPFINIHLASDLGTVAKCTLSGAVNNINVDGRSYCVVDHGNKKHPDAFEFCKKLNARLPLPRNKQEAAEFLKLSPSWTNVDARNPKKTSNEAEWVDAEGKPLGNRPVYLRGQKFILTRGGAVLCLQTLKFRGTL